MSDISRKKELDDFWDIEFIAPRKSPVRRENPKADELVEITVSSVLEDLADKEKFHSEKLSFSDEPHVIRKQISPEYDEPFKNKDTLELEYSPENSLIHRVRIFKWKTSYSYYDDFLRDARRLLPESVEFAEHVPYFSYVPQYDQLDPKQTEYYLYFRSEARRGNYIDADYSYILLYIYEIINLGDLMDTSFGQDQLCGLWKAYRKKHIRLNKLLIEWICDYSFMNRLPPPRNISLQDVADICSVKEFFAVYTKTDYRSYADVLLAFSSSYDYHTSKFASGDTLKLFEEYIPSALSEGVKYLSRENLTENAGFNDSRLPRDAYAGALCSHRIKRRIDLEYCSFSKTNEFRYLVGDIVKYSENKIRAHMGIKSRLSCYSLDAGIRAVLDAFFKERLIKPKKTAAKEKRTEYDVLYDLPRKAFSLSDARRIEEESWDTTNELIETFDDGEKNEEVPNTVLETPICDTLDVLPNITENADGTVLKQALGELADFALAVYRGDLRAQRETARKLGRMSDGIADEINEKSFDIIGDVLIEDAGGEYRIVEDYEVYFTDWED
ncbi:MAG: TerB N-terminal domain-containing protein [Clostridia bacterium]|nr:TerB N-terminal domain-containing protein [Clostridia bacterium]